MCKCEKSDDCDTFAHKINFYNQSPGYNVCHLFKGGKITEVNYDYSSGYCPRVNPAGLPVYPPDITAPRLLCSARDPTKLCNFPFKYGGSLYWEPVVVNHTEYCSTELVEEDWERLSDLNEEELKPSGPCQGKRKLNITVVCVQRNSCIA